MVLCMPTLARLPRTELIPAGSSGRGFEQKIYIYYLQQQQQEQ